MGWSTQTEIFVTIRALSYKNSRSVLCKTGQYAMKFRVAAQINRADHHDIVRKERGR